MKQTLFVGALLSLLLSTSPTFAQVPEIARQAVEILPSPQTKVKLEYLGRFIKGFPAILKFKCTGPQAIPQASLFRGDQNVSVDLVSKKDGKSYSIKSKAVNIVEFHTQFGSRDVPMDVPLIPLSAGEQRTMLLDLSSLLESKISRFQLAKSFRLANVPSGLYRLKVTFTNPAHSLSPFNPPSDLPVSQRDIEIKSPSPQQQAFLDKFKKQYLASKSIDPSIFPEGVHPTWAEFLNDAMPLTDLVRDLDAPARQLMSFHLLLSEFIMYPADLEKFDEKIFKRLEAMPVPKYLKLDKKCLLLEIHVTNGKAAKFQKQIDALLRQDKGLTWRIESAKRREFIDFLYAQNRYIFRNPLQHR